MPTTPTDTGDGWLASQIEARFAIGPRTLGIYAERGLIAHPKLRGRNTRWNICERVRR